MRIATFNLESLDLAPGAEAAFARRAAVLRPQLEALRADILCLQEINGQHVAGESGRALTALERLLAKTRYDGYHRFASPARPTSPRSEEHTSELQSLMRISYAVFCLQKKKTQTQESTACILTP